MYQAVDAVFNLNEGAKVGEVADAAFNHGSGRITFRQMLPGFSSNCFMPARCGDRQG